VRCDVFCRCAERMSLLSSDGDLQEVDCEKEARTVQELRNFVGGEYVDVLDGSTAE